jgi:hypothetical protein
MMDLTHEEDEVDLVSLTFLVLGSPWTIRRGYKFIQEFVVGWESADEWG